MQGVCILLQTFAFCRVVHRHNFSEERHGSRPNFKIFRAIMLWTSAKVNVLTFTRRDAAATHAQKVECRNMASERWSVCGVIHLTQSKLSVK